MWVQNNAPNYFSGRAMVVQLLGKLHRKRNHSVNNLFLAFWEARNIVRIGESEVHPHCIAEKIIAYVDMVLLNVYELITSNRCDPNKPKKWAPLDQTEWELG